MKIENSIGWCDDTGNKVTGCDKVSPGCKNCYAEVGTRARVLRAQGIETWGPKGVRHPVAGFAASLRRLNKLCVCDKCHEAQPFSRVGQECGAGPAGCLADDECNGTLRRIRFFADSNSDWLDDKWPIEMLASFLKEIRDAPNVDVLLLTKRPENWKARMFRASHAGVPMIGNWMQRGECPANIWIGVSVEDQKRADERIPLLLQIPAKVRFLSVEPLLEMVDLKFMARSFGFPQHITDDGRAVGMPQGIHWVIVGGESGKERRDCGVEAINFIVQQCSLAGVPVFVKQDCAFKSGQQGRIPAHVWALKQFPGKGKGQSLVTSSPTE